MSSVCISNCVNDTRDPRIPVRATYVNLYKWPESDAEFVRSVTSRGDANVVRRGVGGGLNGHHGHPRVVDSISCRQMYLRSYTFSREEENVSEKKTMCFGRGKDKKKEKKAPSSSNVEEEGKRKRKDDDKARRRRKRKCLVLRKISCSALLRIFYRLLSCSASVDVVDR
ncbi:hypothetical protein ACOSP7_029835 [Xanthoceras sorbifolium]|uniref:Uncharacterized protein n=1 Tax=Xanthoceras sorbifolium TaxID=99658 RepID=A0ABQ8HAC8_9ROSI|nr:hypothetical protein JRO89_XS12G0013200 [Xanthoceras sorbifolium]